MTKKPDRHPGESRDPVAVASNGEGAWMPAFAGMTIKLMGILNITPDSFSDGNQFLDPQKAIAHGLRMMDEGASIIDIGGESTRPGAETLTETEEQKRVLPILTGLSDEAEKRGITLSIDTRNAGTMKAALDAGAGMINDISALTHDPAAMGIAARSNAKIVLMHMQGTPQTMQKNPVYQDVVREVRDYLKVRIEACLAAGITKDRLIVDPGIGFGKTPEHNIALLKNIAAFQELDVPVMIGASRKSFIQTITGPCPPEQRLGGSLAVALYTAGEVVTFLRVHDVAETKQALRMWAALA